MKRITVLSAFVAMAISSHAQTSTVKKGGLLFNANQKGPKSLLNLYLAEAQANDTITFRIMSVGTEPLEVAPLAVSAGLKVINDATGTILPGNFKTIQIVVEKVFEPHSKDKLELVVQSNSGRDEKLVIVAVR